MPVSTVYQRGRTATALVIGIGTTCRKVTVGLHVDRGANLAHQRDLFPLGIHIGNGDG